MTNSAEVLHVGAPLIYTVDEAASALRIGRNAVYEEIASGRLKSFTQGRRRRIAHADLVAFVNALRRDAEPKSPRSLARKVGRAVRS